MHSATTRGATLLPLPAIKLVVAKVSPFCKAFWRVVAFCAVLGYLLLCPLVTKPLYDAVMFMDCRKQSEPYPPIALNDITGQDVWITTPNNTKLHAILFDKPGSKYITVLHHGQGGNVPFYAVFAQLMTLNGTSALLYDYEGYGRSEGSPGLDKIVRDGTAVHDYVTSHTRFDGKHIVHMGISLGSGVACNVTKARDAAAVILMSPYSSYLQTAHHALPWLNAYPDWAIPYPDIENLSMAKARKAPMLLLQGTDDLTIPFSQSEAIANAAGDTCTFIKFTSTGHAGFLEERNQIKTWCAIKDFLKKIGAS